MKAYLVERPASDWCQDYTSGALYMGASPKEAVKAACDLCAMVCEPIICESINK